MRMISLVILLTILVFNQGCCNKTQEWKIGCQDECIPDTIIVKEKVYIKQKVPPIPEEPIPDEYQTIKIKLNDTIYYSTDKYNSAIMSGNWESYKGYAKSLRNILYNMQDSNSSKDVQ